MDKEQSVAPNVIGLKRLLAVDDHADSAQLVARIAGMCGYQARSTDTPSGVVPLLRSWKPDILTLDLCMPDTDGVELLSMLQEYGFAGPLVIISGQHDQFRRAIARLAEGRGLCVAAEMAKPVDTRALRILLSTLRMAA